MTKKTITAIIIISSCFFSSCKAGKEDKSEKARQEIAQTEKDFEKMAMEKGIADAFEYFADSTAVIKKRNDSLVFGKSAIRQMFSGEYFRTAKVRWTADFIDAAKSGELGYTYGKYVWELVDSAGKIESSTGVFHTVWKKQKDGSWRYVWD